MESENDLDRLTREERLIYARLTRRAPVESER